MLILNMKLFDKFVSVTKPPDSWKVSVIIISGILSGLILLIIYVGNATSYLSDKPETCINCHVMYTQYASWRISHTQGSQHAMTVMSRRTIFSENIFQGV